MRLSSPGFVPVYRWGVALPARPSRPVDLGEISLQQGASVSGRIEVSGTGAPLAGCGVRLGIPSARASDDLETRRRLELLTASASSNAFGFFQLSGLAPGTYELQATCPGRAVATLAPVEVVQGLETRLKEPLVSGLPVSLSLAVVPPLDPYGRPWRLRLWAERSVPGAASSQTGTVDDNGVWQASGLQPELHHLLVLSEDGEGWMEREVDLRRGDARELVTIPLVEVRGASCVGESPPGVLLFGGRQAARSVRLPVDLEGRFEGFLPEEGPWWVVWQASRQDPGGTDLGEVEVRKRAGKSFAELELSLPDTRLTGLVVDESGRPVPEARVAAGGSSQKTRGGRARAPQMTTDTDHDGKFELLGLPAGTAMVSAMKPDQDLESDYQDVELREGEEGPELRLVLRSQRTFSGRVTSGGSPIPGARVLAGPDLASSRAAKWQRPWRTLPAVSPIGCGSARWVDLVAWAPGHVCAFRRFVADPSQRFEIDLPAAGGSLELELGSLAQAGSTVLWIGSTPVLAFSLDLLSRRGLVEAPAPGVFRLANIEPATVLACQGRAAIAALLSDAPPPPEACVSGTIQVQANLSCSCLREGRVAKEGR
ncbi:MAG: carboxypeptidase-like regulatory domain-containing protein [Thermoanaerobaculia bacterium]